METTILSDKMDILHNINGDEIFRNLFEHSTVGMSITSLDNRLQPNAAFCEMLGYSMEELLNKPWEKYTHPDDLAYNHAMIDRIMSGQEKSVRWEKRYIHKNGSTIWGDIHTFLHRDANGLPLHFITTVNNITKPKDIEAALIESEQSFKFQNELLLQSNTEKDKFFAILAHDLRSPLSSFLGLAEVMSEEINNMTMSEIEDITKSMFLSASNLYQLLENLLEWSILRRGNTEYHPEPTSLNSLILRSMDPFTESARSKNIALKFPHEQDFTVDCDIKMTETILRNLISNALKYTYEKGSVVLNCKSVNDNEILISVKDNGIGMEEALCSKLFKLNEQVSRKGTEGESSSGLGLLICKELVELQEGKIWAESTEHEGSTFFFTLKGIN
ncbi:MAG: PAS domain S-box protein [Prolixibacteraceae bacterium]|nr:PAS domain S-box protein [Prolixibacteraceae bacterium]